jgi:hypothetical protein
VWKNTHSWSPVSTTPAATGMPSWPSWCPENCITEVQLPSLLLLHVRDLPSFLAVTSEDDPFAFMLPEFHELVDALERDDGSSKPPTYVLANICDAMEANALASLMPHMDIFVFGHMLPFLHEADDGRCAPPPCNAFDHDKSRYSYLSWLDTKPAKSVVRPLPQTRRCHCRLPCSKFLLF